ncbi:carboxypeptidase D [Trichonephila inaurata madagascariensis]|uniref:Carboxypeptidase D n=1 Tax=Trichonephila inaurata madagascariensis TaxID=2747483 RepID=A0A8X6Y675_9ARAC|nr:carboxypeptidase D [Trichonephila inaurata madagascariensis]
MASFTISMVLVLFVASVVLPSTTALNIDFAYHNFPQMTAVLRQLANEYPELTKLYSIGKSVQGRDLWVMLVTNNPDEEPLLKPNVKYVANMHGNEPVGRELMLHLLSLLLDGYGKDDYVTWLLDNTRIHIMPSMNPDGFEASSEGECSGVQGRGNANNADLNRNFPDYFAGRPKVPIQPETRAVMDWIRQIQFVLSGNFHGGALVASYPFDNIPANSPKNFRKFGSPSRTPDDDVFKHLAEVYSFNHKNMYLGVTCRDGSPPFPNGTTNGAAWYSLIGGMQDYNYVWGSCMEITLEISCCKYPKSYQLPQFWNDNQKAILQYLGEVHQGIWGQVTDQNKNPVSNATIKIKGRDFGTRTTYRGEYWRILRPGTYVLHAEAKGYDPVELTVDVSKGVIIQNITLYQQSSTYYEPRSEPTFQRGSVPSISPVHNAASTFGSGSLKGVWPTFTVNETFTNVTSLNALVNTDSLVNETFSTVNTIADTDTIDVEYNYTDTNTSNDYNSAPNVTRIYNQFRTGHLHSNQNDLTNSGLSDGCFPDFDVVDNQQKFRLCECVQVWNVKFSYASLHHHCNLLSEFSETQRSCDIPTKLCVPNCTATHRLQTPIKSLASELPILWVNENGAKFSTHMDVLFLIS